MHDVVMAWWSAAMTRHLDELFKGLPERLEVSDVAEVLGMSRQAAYRALQTGTIPAYKVGASWLILRDELKDWIAEHSNSKASVQAEAAATMDDGRE